jgi:hypothetical protein
LHSGKIKKENQIFLLNFLYFPTKHKAKYCTIILPTSKSLRNNVLSLLKNPFKKFVHISQQALKILIDDKWQFVASKSTNHTQPITKPKHLTNSKNKQKNTQAYPTNYASS